MTRELAPLPKIFIRRKPQNPTPNTQNPTPNTPKNNQMKRLIFIFLILLTGFASKAQKYTLSGYVTDQSTGEPLIGATIYDRNSQKGTQTNSFGFYSLSLPANDSILLGISYIGYTTRNEKMVLTQNRTINFGLQEGIQIEAVSVTADKPINEKNEMGVLEIPVSQLKIIPAIGAEPDLMKAYQLMPGVQSGSEGSSGLYVRGGSPDQNLILLDDVTLYYVNHLGGFVSTFNSEAINNVKLVKGSLPAHYGGRLSSVMDIRMKDGNINKLSVNYTIGTLISGVTVQAPLKKDTSSFLISARGFFWGFLYQPISRILLKDVSVGYNFYDVNAKFNRKINKNNRIYFSFYTGDDNLAFRIKDKIFNSPEKGSYTLRWGNFLSAVRWNKIYSPKLFSNLTLAYTRYRYVSAFKHTVSDTRELMTDKYKTGINDLSLKYEFDYFVSGNYDIKTGIDFISHSFNPGVTQFLYQIKDSTVSDFEVGNKSVRAYEGSFYLENKIKIADFIDLNVGVRIADYFAEKNHFFSVEPRILCGVSITDKSAVKLSYTEMQQNVHLLTSSTVSMPVEIWVPATKIAKPADAQQFAVGFFKSMIDSKLELSVEAYYKRTKNLIAYKEGISYQGTSQNWQQKIETDGKGISYGIELLLQKKIGKLTGWFAYTYSKTNRQFENINNGNPYPFKYDRTHDLSIVAAYKITDNIDVSISWVFGTGYPFTLPKGKYPIINDNSDYYKYYDGEPDKRFFTLDEEAYIWEDLNSRRMRSFHHLDLGVNFRKEKKRGIRTWAISVYNVYSRQNPYFYYVDYDKNEYKLFQQSLFPIIPSISYNFKF